MLFDFRTVYTKDDNYNNDYHILIIINITIH